MPSCGAKTRAHSGPEPGAEYREGAARGKRGEGGIGRIRLLCAALVGDIVRFHVALEIMVVGSLR